MRLASTALFAVLMGCPNDRGTFSSEQPEPFRFADVASSHSRAEYGEMVQVTWDFDGGEPDAQEVCFLHMFFNDLVEDCTPLDPTYRTIYFEFEGPIHVNLRASMADGQIAQAVFPIKYREDAFLRAEFSQNAPGLPSLGVDRVIDFMEFAAFEDTNNDGIIEGLDTSQGGEIFDSTTNHSPFRAWTRDPFQTEFGNWEFNQGPWFPAAVPTDPFQGFARRIVYGGALEFTGESQHLLKTDDGNEDVVWTSGAELYYDPIFLQISFYDHGTLLTPTDVQLGNLYQGLVLGVASTDQRGTTGLFTDQTVVRGHDPAVWFQGDIKGGEVGHTVTLMDGTFREPTVFLDSVEWSLPLISDADIGESLTLDLW